MRRLATPLLPAGAGRGHRPGGRPSVAAECNHSLSHSCRAVHLPSHLQALVEGSIQVADLPRLWNEKMKEYLGCEPESDARGVLQVCRHTTR